MSSFFSPWLQQKRFFTLAPWCLDLDGHIYSILLEGGVKEVAFDPCHEWCNSPLKASVSGCQLKQIHLFDYK